jgi:hypothetical protein
VLIRGLSMVRTNDEMLCWTGRLYDGRYGHVRLGLMLGGEERPA